MIRIFIAIFCVVRGNILSITVATVQNFNEVMLKKEPKKIIDKIFK